MKPHSTAGALLAASAALAHAGAPVIYDSRADFESNTTSLHTENFESEALGDLALPGVFTSGLGASLASGSVTSYIDAGDPLDYGMENTTIGGRNYLAFGRDGLNADGSPHYETGAYSVEFALPDAARAFAFDLSGVILQHTAMGFNVTTLNNGQVMDDFFVPSAQIFDAQFYGMVTDNAFDAIRIGIPVDAGLADYAAFDDVTWGDPVPSPAGVPLLALGALLATRRKR